MTPDAVLQKHTAKRGSESPEEGKKRRRTWWLFMTFCETNMAQKGLFFFFAWVCHTGPKFRVSRRFFLHQKEKEGGAAFGSCGGVGWV